MVSRLLSAAVRLLPPERRDWGTAMLAELDGISPRADRRRFVLGCLGVIVTRPAAWGRLGYPLLVGAVSAATLVSTSQVAYPPLHGALIGLVGVLVVVSWFGRTSLRVRPAAVPRALRASAYLLVGAQAAAVVMSLAHKDRIDLAGPPVFAVIFAGYLLGFLALTARSSAATSRTLLVGAAFGVGAAAIWTAFVFAFPPIPRDAAAAVFVTVAAMALAAVLARPRLGVRAASLAAACAGSIAALLIFSVVVVVAAAGPDYVIPHLAPPSLSPAVQLSESRIEIEDPYLWTLLLGWFASWPSVLGRRRDRVLVHGPAGEGEVRR